ncbi:hypothetical protein ROJ8625_01152 [Roseivivax jejudonensis]|uniref:Lipocalin-like domain protein n=1 Tax=Roseivivax jejudonensis TaxID=1529041 RepID=A0A1X6YPT9_9RHOB|nr:hypothetical protein ROJ8625_01152 [Roseivivax jejudonensis]
MRVTACRNRGAFAALCLALGLMACGRAGPDADAPAPVAGLRDPSAPVGAQVDADQGRLIGRWVVVEGAGVPPGAPVEFAPGRMRIAGQAYDLVETGPGRFAVGGRPLWVHWLDADTRTVALGDPGGGWAFVLDRTGQPGERLVAAEEILDWYGYDLAALRGVGAATAASSIESAARTSAAAGAASTASRASANRR